jgi:pyruvate kinase
MRRNRKAKIVATLGPASSSSETLRALFDAGADLFRLNFSHGTHESHKAFYDTIRAIESDTGRPIGIMVDLQGPKVRIGEFAHGPITLNIGDLFRLDLDITPGDKNRVQLPHAAVFQALTVGQDLLIDDGKVRLQVISCGSDHAETVVTVGGDLRDHKGVNVPGVELAISALTEKDREDLAFGLELGADWVAQSFVQKPEDVAELRELIGDRASIIVKLEQPSALHMLEEIVELSDAIMVARGDLGVELPPEQVPGAQKHIIQVCRKAGKPVVVATHMLDSMVHTPVPTRAEASDVATAVYDGVDAVMLSAESASGDYPVQSVKMMDQIIAQVERDPYYRNILEAVQPESQDTVGDAVCSALRQVTRVLSTTVIVTYTSSGYTALRAARQRPKAPILSLTPAIGVARKLAMAWGVHAVQVDVTGADTDVTQVLNEASRIAVEQRFAKCGDNIAIAAGLPFGQSGSTNLLHINRIGD